MGEKKPYTKKVTLFKFIGAIFAAFKDPKAAGATLAMVTLMGSGGYALNDLHAKHLSVLSNISKNEERVIGLLLVQEKMLVKLDSIKEGIDETKINVEKTRDRVWQIARDVYILKNQKGD